MYLEGFAEAIGVSRMTLFRIENGQAEASKSIMESVYSYAYERGFLFNTVKCDFAEDNRKGNILLYHGAKQEVVGVPDNKHNKSINDFGNGFYMGETYAQAATWISGYPEGSVYAFYFDSSIKLKHVEFTADYEWMIAILYYRGLLGKWGQHPLVQDIIAKVETSDYVIAPIADNLMYDILDQFAKRRITDEQCRHALAANDLGRQYVFRSQKALDALSMMGRLYVCKLERRDWMTLRRNNSQRGAQKVDVALTHYRREGKYIDELFE